MTGFLSFLHFAGKTRQAATCPLDLMYEYNLDKVAVWRARLPSKFPTLWRTIWTSTFQWRDC